MTLTDPNIDGLAGEKLFIAVAESCGYTRLEYKGAFAKYVGTDKHNQRLTLPNYLDEGAAFRLLMELDSPSWSIERFNNEITGPRVRIWDTANGKILAEGKPEEAASVMLKAWLKLKARE